MKPVLFGILFIVTQALTAQSLIVRETDSRTESPTVVWQTVGAIDTMDFRIFRASVKDKKFREIHTLHYVQPSKSGDTLFLNMVDTTLTKKGIYLYYAEALRDGRPVVSATALAHNLGLIPRPQVISFTATPLTDRKAIRLSWKLNYTETVGSLTLYRSNQYEKGYTPVAELAPGDESYTDVVPRANEPWFYFLEVNNYFGGKTRSVRTPAFATFREKPFPPQDVIVTANDNSILFDWRNVGDNIIGYRVYRSIGERPFQLITGLLPAAAGTVHYADSSAAMKKAYHVRYYIRNVSDGFAESSITDTFEVYLPQHQPVYPPAQVDHIPDARGYVRLLWVPDKRGFVTGYNVYVKSPGGDTLQLNDSLIVMNSFTDNRPLPAGRYLYLVEGVGMNGKKSEKRARVAVDVLPPHIEVLLDLQKEGSGIRVSWKKPAGSQAKSLVLYRRTGAEKPVALKTFSAGEDGSYTDREVSPGRTYLYEMTVLLQDGRELPLDNAVEMRF